jgi:PAS domain S-box-containing protein
MMEKKLKVLLIEDSENDMKLLKRELQKGGYIVDLIWIQTIEEMISALKEEEFDVIISDYSMPKFNGFEALRLFKESSLDKPFILVSGTIGEDIAVNVMKNGANDYIMKDHLKRLVPAIEREIKDCFIRQEHKRAQDALIQSEIKFRRIFENIQDVYYQSDLKGTILEISPSVEKYSFYKREELIGKSVIDFYDNQDNRNRFLEELFQYGEVRDFEIRLKAKVDKVIFCSINSHLLYDNNGTPIAMEGSLRDISERKNSELELIKALKKAEESDRLKTAFLQNISHEIRTPLNGIIGFSKLLLDENNTREEINEFNNMIQHSGKRLLEIVNNVLDISKIETGQININKKTFSINSLLKDLYSFFLPIANLKELKLNCHNFLEDENSTIYSDYLLLNQILSNLINNAVKFTQSGEIEFGYEIVDFENDKVGKFILFYVKDTGIGIPDEYHKKIFDRFTQTDLSITRGFEGAGLGLAISKGLVELLGGRIWVQSEVRVGSTFLFTIPFISSEKKEIFEDDFRSFIKDSQIEQPISKCDYDWSNYHGNVLKSNYFLKLQSRNRMYMKNLYS